MNSTMKLEDNVVYKKYHNKTIRVRRKIYTIRIFEGFGSVVVELTAKYRKGDFYIESRSDTEYEGGAFDCDYAESIAKAKEILAELEEAEQPDFEEQLEEEVKA